MDIDVKSQLLSQGELRVTGRLVDASNATLYATTTLGSDEMSCIYKPVAGERPLWDFADGCLANREYATYLISREFDFNLVPLTVLRDGPYGLGMAQEWIEVDSSIDLAAFFSTDHPALRQMAIFDAVVNNTDRKIGHLLPISDEVVFGCDHGVTFHVEDKLRTVLWQWADQRLSTSELEQLTMGLDLLDGPLEELLTPLLLQEEIAATRRRIERLISSGRFPLPNPNWPAVPWPAF